MKNSKNIYIHDGQSGYSVYNNGKAIQHSLTLDDAINLAHKLDKDKDIVIKGLFTHKIKAGQSW